jgi:putative inorganic carbon (hco3(-)) transporter
MHRPERYGEWPNRPMINSFSSHPIIKATPTLTLCRARTERSNPRALVARRHIWAECLALVLAAPVLWFPSVRPALVPSALLLLLASWSLDRLLGGSLWPASAYNPALCALLVMAAVGAWRSWVPGLTLSKVTALLLGLALWRAIIRWVDDERGLWLAVLGVLGLALAFALVGLTNGLRAAKAPTLSAILHQLPRWLQHLPETEQGRASTNQLGGVLLLVVPLALGAALAPWARRDLPEGTLDGLDRLLAVILAAVMAILLGAALLLTQSRGAWAGLAVGLVALVALRWRWGRWFLLVATMLTMAAYLLVGRDLLAPHVALALSDARGMPTSVGTLSLSGRIQIWARAWEYIADMPLLGGGLGTFRARYAGYVGGSWEGVIFDIGVPHAHNVFIQMAYDVGLVGLAAYLALVGLALWDGLRLCREGSGLCASLAAGVVASLLAYHVYGLTDTVALGAKPGVLFWAVLALV